MGHYRTGTEKLKPVTIPTCEYKVSRAMEPIEEVQPEVPVWIDNDVEFSRAMELDTSSSMRQVIPPRLLEPTDSIKITVSLTNFLII